MKQLVLFLICCVSLFGQTKGGIPKYMAGGGGGGGATIPAITNLISGDGTGNGANSGIAPSTVVKGAAGITIDPGDQACVVVASTAAAGTVICGEGGYPYFKQNEGRLISYQFRVDGTETVYNAPAFLFTSAGMMAGASGYSTAGTPVTISGCSADTPAGGGTAGTFISRTSGTCTVVITLNGATGITAPTGWACNVNNQTTANLIRQTATSQTTVTVSGTTVSGDVIRFGCIGY